MPCRLSAGPRRVRWRPASSVMIVSTKYSWIYLHVPYLWLLALLEESLLTSLVRLLLPGEVRVAGNLVNNTRVNAADVDLCPGGDNVAGVDTSERNTVDLERTGDEEYTLVEGLQENDTLSTEATGEENENGTGLERGARLVWTDSLADLW